MFYEHRGTTIFKVLGSLIYFVIDIYVCLYYLCLQYNKWVYNDNSFDKFTFDDVYGIGITEVLMNIMSWHGFKK